MYKESRRSVFRKPNRPSISRHSESPMEASVWNILVAATNIMAFRCHISALLSNVRSRWNWTH